MGETNTARVQMELNVLSEDHLTFAKETTVQALVGPLHDQVGRLMCAMAPPRVEWHSLPPGTHIQYQLWVGKSANGPHEHKTVGDTTSTVELPLTSWRQELLGDGSFTV